VTVQALRPVGVRIHAFGIVVLVACATTPVALPNNTAPTTVAPPPAAPAPLPAEVTTLIERWTTCWHFRGEEPYNAARQREIEAGVEKWCPGNDEERARLRVAWKARADVIAALAKLDEMQ
jgi:hypothetical protein